MKNEGDRCNIFLQCNLYPSQPFPASPKPSRCSPLLLCSPYRLRNHASDSNLPPILIYPEGVCVNNTSVMQFKKGAFEASLSPPPSASSGPYPPHPPILAAFTHTNRSTHFFQSFPNLIPSSKSPPPLSPFSILLHCSTKTLLSLPQVDTVFHPIAIRFDARFGDAFWWQDKFFHYVMCMMTSWAIVCNVWYLPPMKKTAGESATAFADRVKAKIAHQGGMIDLAWDGFLKAHPVKDEWKKRQQEEFAKHLQPVEEMEEDHQQQQQSEESDRDITNTMKTKED
ncbi:Glycerol-3-phosphate acyltransferase 3-like [Chionoecetes opilio]|uniref:Glycerol-3-phosphate acyltransferase 3-like n=1 Tax=Chionoecetes opilio TaxID=41210 RepID=A0A8J4XPW9_CHIOP|nr:Glycerol-3-phosphate acyltransferase 3-like [Chionoecetes opilio]